MAGDIDRRIRERAFEIWESEGRPDGRAEDHWKQARAEFTEAATEAAQNSTARDTVESAGVKKATRRRSATLATPPRDRSDNGERIEGAKPAPKPRRKKP